MIQSKKRLVSIIFLLASVLAYSQKSAVYKYGDNEYLRGLQLYEKEKYGAAREAFTNYLNGTDDTRSEIRSEASYYRAMSALELRNDDSEFLVYTFISEYPESANVNDAVFRLAKYFYDKNSWARSVSWFNRVDRHELTPTQLSEYYFKKGYSYYERNDYEEARANLYEIQEVESVYNAPAIYYYSHINYVQGNYETALLGFRKIDSNPLFSEIAPYYISQILYMQRKYDEVINYSHEMLDSVSEKRLGEISKIVGESYYMLGMYAEAIPYLETYKDNSSAYTIHDRYQLAIAYYNQKEFENAMPLFEQISYRDTEIAQSAHYHLADCYLKLGDMNKARIAFSQAAKMEFDPKIQQDAMFNYAKVTYELAYSPFNEAIRAFEDYIRSYPAADNTDEAYNYLVNAYLGTRNYSMALVSIQKIKRKDARIERALQKVAFYRGLELYKNLRFNEAVEALELSQEYSTYDPVIASRNYFWLGEAAYRSGDPKTARIFYNEFLKDASSIYQQEYVICHYSIGYIYFDDEDYPNAISWFKKYLNLEKNQEAHTLSDAYNRMGDCYFVGADYASAITYYDRSIAAGMADADYALFQKGFTLGLLDKTPQKVEVLNKLLVEQSTSNFNDDALFEIGRSYVALGDLPKAQAYYERLVDEHPNSSYTNKALNQLGLIYYNQSDYDRALTYYEQVATNYPGTSEADNALTSIKNIYVRKDNVDEYLDFVTGLGQDITLWEQDSLAYTAAELVYTRGDCEETIRDFKDYLDAFPNGRFLLNAHFYKADCQLKLQENQEALQSLDYIIAQPRNMFTEPALEAASKINFREKDYHRAIETYRALLDLAEKKTNITEAQIGLMRCYANLGESSNTIEAAREVLQLGKLQEEIIREANFNIATSFYDMNELDFAYDYFLKVAHEVNSSEGAESKYRIIEILFERENMDAAEEEVFSFIEMNTPHQYWMGMAFLALSDIYMAKGDEFSAINALQALIDSYTIPDDGIIANAKQRKVELTEQAESEIAPEPGEAQ